MKKKGLLMLIRPMTLEEAKEGGKAAARHLVEAFRKHEVWCREHLLPIYKELPVNELVRKLYETQLIYSWCLYNARCEEHEQILKTEVPCTGEEIQEVVIALLGCGSEKRHFDEAVSLLLLTARKEGYFYGTQGFCVATTPFGEEIDLMVEALKQRHCNVS